MYPRGPAAAALREAGVPVYATVEQAVDALARLSARPRRAVAGASRRSPAAGRPGRRHGGYEAARVAAGRGRHRVRGPARRDQRRREALAAARELGYPVVLKALGRLHKSDAGGVVLGVADDADARAGLRRAAAPSGARALLGRAHGAAERRRRAADRRPLGRPLRPGRRWPARRRLHRGAARHRGGPGPGHPRPRRVDAPLAARGAAADRRPRAPAGWTWPPRRRRWRRCRDVAAAHPELAELEINPLLVTPGGALALDARARPSPPPSPTQEPTPCSSPTPRSSSPSASAPAA